MPNRYQQSKDELRAHLAECIDFLHRSATSFDSGATAEARRLATTVRVLLHDTKHSKSLLGQLGIKQTLRLLDSAIPYNPKNLLSYHGLVGTRLGAGQATYWAPLGGGSNARSYRKLPFADWWNIPVIVDNNRASFCRRELVLHVANADGGAHVDSGLDLSYANLTRKNSIGWMAFSNGQVQPMNGIELYSLRQIAFEVIQSMPH